MDWHMFLKQDINLYASNLFLNIRQNQSCNSSRLYVCFLSFKSTRNIKLLFVIKKKIEKDIANVLFF